MIELIGVVGLIAILVGIAQANFGGTKQDAYEDAMITDLKNFRGAQEQHFNRHDRYMGAFQASGTTTPATGNFRLSEDVGLRVTSVTQNGYAADVTHRKWTQRICGVVVTTHSGARHRCMTGPDTTMVAFVYQD